MTDLSRNLAVPECALAVGAHPDDVEFGAGATLAKWAAAGTRIHHLVCTDGSKGTWEPEVDPAALAARRQEEQRVAARILGGRDPVRFLGWPDGELEAGLRPRWQVAYWIRWIRPDVVLGHDPWRRYRLHPDHRNAGFLVTDGIVAARDPQFFPEQGLAPHRPTALLLWEAEEPDHVEDATDYVETKVAAILAHRSQFRSTMGIGGPAASGPAASGPAADGASAASSSTAPADVELERFRARIHERLAENGALAGFAHGEAFKLLTRL